jgi:hypothetical protein
MELELAGAKESELAREIRVGKQLHGLQDAAQARSRDDMHNGTIVAGDGDKRATLSGMDGCCRLALEVLDAVCILHRKKVYFNRAHVKIVEVARLAAHFQNSIGRVEVPDRSEAAHEHVYFRSPPFENPRLIGHALRANCSARVETNAWKKRIFFLHLLRG